MIALQTGPNETHQNGPPHPDQAGEGAVVRGATPAERATEVDAVAYAEHSAWLSNEADRLFTQGHYAASEQRVRELLALQERVAGTNHADYALALSMLGELRFVQNDWLAAEKLFRLALALRAQLLGDRHPDYAVSLMCLAGVLWRRGGVDEAEGLLRRALAIRYEVLGEAHPDSVTSRKELARLLRLRGDWSGAQALVRPAVAKPGIDLRSELTAVGEALARLGGVLGPAGMRMARPGVPPSAEQVAELAALRGGFERLRALTIERIGALGVPPPEAEAIGTLHDLAAVLDDLAEVEIRQGQWEQVRLAALAILARVLGLEYYRGEGFPPLDECLERASRLRETIATTHWASLPAQTAALADGTHALVHLLILVEQRERLSDRSWAQLHELVGQELGRDLASAASRGRIAIASARPRVVAERRSEPGSGPEASRPVQDGPPAGPAPVDAAATGEQDVAELVRDLAVASLVPTMGRVINLPNDASDEVSVHRLLRRGQAPVVVVRPPGPDPVEPDPAPEPSGPVPPGKPRGPEAGEVARRFATQGRIGPAIVAGPLALLEHDNAFDELAAELLGTADGLMSEPFGGDFRAAREAFAASSRLRSNPDFPRRSG
jgi:tetratricopeptide (TPR) repeat protein